MEDWVEDKEKEGEDRNLMLSSLLNPSFQPFSIPAFPHTGAGKCERSELSS